MPLYVMRVTFDNHLKESGHQTEYLEIEGETPSLAEIEATTQISKLLNLQGSPLSRVSNLVTEIIPPEQVKELIVGTHPKPDGGYFTVDEVAHTTSLSIRGRV